jgi:hypothetical protein
VEHGTTLVDVSSERGPAPLESGGAVELACRRAPCRPVAAGGRLVWYDSLVNSILSVLRYVWAAPTTALGILAVLAGLSLRRIRVVDGVLEAHGPALAWLLSHCTPVPGGAAALTLGHVVIGRDLRSLDLTRVHERVHVRQSEAWGPLFVPLYVAASLWVALRGGHFYRDNPFEREAFAEGGPNSPRGTLCQ